MKDFSQAELKALEYFHAEFFRHAPGLRPEYVRTWLVRIALLHPRELAGWFQATIAYADAECLDVESYVQRQIATRPEYRRRPKAPKRSGRKTE